MESNSLFFSNPFILKYSVLGGGASGGPLLRNGEIIAVRHGAEPVGGGGYVASYSPLGSRFDTARQTAVNKELLVP